MPNVTSHDAVIYTANDLITALTTPQPTNSVLSIGNDQLVAFRKLATIFQCSIHKKTNCRSGGTRHCTTTPTTHTQSNQSISECSHQRHIQSYRKPHPNTTMRRPKKRGQTGPRPHLRHPTQQTTHRPHHKKFTPTVPYKTQGNVGRSFPSHPIRELCRGPQHRKTARVQTTHQSSRSQVPPNVAAFERQGIRKISARRRWMDQRHRHHQISTVPRNAEESPSHLCAFCL